MRRNPKIWNRLATLSVGVLSTLTLLNLALPAFARDGMLTARYSTSAINVRRLPTTNSNIQYVGRVGDRVEVLRALRGYSDSYTWHQVRFPSGIEGWVREDLINVNVSETTIGSDGGADQIATRPAPISIPPVVPVTPNPDPLDFELEPLPLEPPQSQPEDPTFQTYTSDQIDYFFEVAMGSEFGSAGSIVRKWNGPIRIGVYGTPTAEDRSTLEAVIRDLRGLTGMDIAINSQNPNLDIYFVPESQFSRYEPNYRPRNYGFFWTRWNNNTIYNSRILISTTNVNQQERSHLIREEFTQSLGLMRDSYRDANSIFFQGWTSTTQYSELDQAIIAMLYRPEIRPGMTATEVRTVLSRLTR